MTTIDAMTSRLPRATTRRRPRPSPTDRWPSRCWPAPSSRSPASCRSASPRARPANIPSRSSPWSTIALIVSWFVAVIFAPLLGVGAAQGRRKAQAPGEPGASCAAVPRLPGRRDARALADDRGDARPVRRLLAGMPLRAAAVLSGVRPARAAGRSDACRRTPRSMRARRIAGRFDALLKDDPDVERWSTYVGRGAIRFYLPLDVQLPNDFFAQAVIVAKDVAARDRLQAQAGEGAGRGVPERRRARLAARARAAGRLAGAVPRQRPGSRRGARRSRSHLGAGRGGRPAHRGASTSTGSSRRARSASRSTRTRRACSA